MNSSVKLENQKEDLDHICSKDYLYQNAVLFYYDKMIERIFQLFSCKNGQQKAVKLQYQKEQDHELERRAYFLMIVYESLQQLKSITAEWPNRRHFSSHLTQANNPSKSYYQDFISSMMLTIEQLTKLQKLIKLKQYTQYNLNNSQIRILQLFYQTQIYSMQILLRFLLIKDIEEEQQRYQRQLEEFNRKFDYYNYYKTHYYRHQQKGQGIRYHTMVNGSNKHPNQNNSDNGSKKKHAFNIKKKDYNRNQHFSITNNFTNKRDIIYCKTLIKEINKILMFYHCSLSLTRIDCTMKIQIQSLYYLLKNKLNPTLFFNLIKKSQIKKYVNKVSNKVLQQGEGKIQQEKNLNGSRIQQSALNVSKIQQRAEKSLNVSKIQERAGKSLNDSKIEQKMVKFQKEEILQNATPTYDTKQYASNAIYANRQVQITNLNNIKSQDIDHINNEQFKQPQILKDEYNNLKNDQEKLNKDNDQFNQDKNERQAVPQLYQRFNIIPDKPENKLRRLLYTINWQLVVGKCLKQKGRLGALQRWQSIDDRMKESFNNGTTANKLHSQSKNQSIKKDTQNGHPHHSHNIKTKSSSNFRYEQMRQKLGKIGHGHRFTQNRCNFKYKSSKNSKVNSSGLQQQFVARKQNIKTDFVWYQAEMPMSQFSLQNQQQQQNFLVDETPPERIKPYPVNCQSKTKPK